MQEVSTTYCPCNRWHFVIKPKPNGHALRHIGPVRARKGLQRTWLRQERLPPASACALGAAAAFLLDSLARGDLYDWLWTWSCVKTRLNARWTIKCILYEVYTNI
ncbi:hypothetical protein H310_00558 [Aphanomyces invadans]|uniref:Uncharacterized protein n=1 Tax=Aphanomyces invadans TaxID=157072 RepID=A0A024UWX4_9STRA|nr:hypothetical protein H310_00558 [Aphanomyces invadans]ETW10188.1 hypothetical protein H310_00558 [Aphanomyces invadans]|eukprot:XP_008861599.1 hypothetical protein H310_00558 [Aphanomyces invadans]